MDRLTEKAKEILKANGYTCVLLSGEVEYHSSFRGVKPLIDFLSTGKNFCGFSAADKTVGAGAAHLYVLLGVSAVWANVISTSAKEILTKNSVAVYCETEVPYIINRAGDGMCPIENAVQGITDSIKAYEVIKETLKKLQKSN
jgi:hypothetical protein